VWLGDCAVCHQPDGSGSTRGPNLQRVGTAMVDFMVSTGRMPLANPKEKEQRRAPKYTPAEIRSLVAYTATFVHGPPVPTVDTRSADLPAGGDLYRQQCAACHQAAGGGGALAHGAEAPSLSHATSVQVVEAMRTGPGNMPVFSNKTLDAQQADEVAAYVQYLRHPRNPGGLSLDHLGPVPEGLVAWGIGLVTLILVTRLLGTRIARPEH
jgi:ubiquinol-cytochrome c reductase cytochrome c subunit